MATPPEEEGIAMTNSGDAWSPSAGEPGRVVVTNPRPGDAARQRRALGFGVRAILAGVALGVVAVPFGLLLFFVEDKWRPLLRVDDGARDGLHAFAVQQRWFVVAMETLATIGRWWVYMPVFAVLVGWLLWRRLTRLAAFVAVTVGVSPGINDLVKSAVHRSRPMLANPLAHEGGASFPSGHAQAAVVAYAVLLLVFLPVLHGAARRVAVGVAVLMVLGIGLSRVALGVHYVSDVLAGYALGAAWVLAMTASFNVWRREDGLRTAQVEEGVEPEQAERLRGGHGPADER
jgi:membrane-associated phospholipid phosphatase